MPVTAGLGVAGVGAAVLFTLWPAGSEGRPQVAVSQSEPVGLLRQRTLVEVPLGDSDSAEAPLGDRGPAEMTVDPAPDEPMPVGESRPPDSTTPPGFVLVEGGRTRIGTTVADARELIAENEPTLAGTIAGETPQVTRSVGDFLLMVTEVTHEQYAEYVQSTGVRPPVSWGEAAVRAARSAEPLEFDAGRWWDENWRSCAWEVPLRSDQPVTGVEHADAEGYARWAGVRLMTEFEFQRACRGDTDSTFPPSDPTGGIHDLCGSVWEWTSSPYVKFDRDYRPIPVEGDGGRGPITAIAGFDASFRSVVGGSSLQGEVGRRVATRMGADRGQRTEGLGFRCAASVHPGWDRALAVMSEVESSSWTADYRLDPGSVMGLERWTSVEGTKRIKDYAVITAYDHILFIPCEGAPERSEEGGIEIGVLSTSLPLQDPALSPGIYALVWNKDLEGTGTAVPLSVPGAARVSVPLRIVPGDDREVRRVEIDCGQVVLRVAAGGGGARGSNLELRLQPDSEHLRGRWRRVPWR